ncbi:syntaxin-1A-like [Anthonomus grandis grandis]|uniref:syntaxin-1A-like n=1 Tax=Anthonomus grandis grandis TaxID=2921223 RepID=UPI00216522AE|nr:syntaxin-1A-like [Anthonomus grandis grandis]
MGKDRLSELQKARNGKNKEIPIDIEEATELLPVQTGLKETFQRSEVLQQWIGSIEENLEGVRDCIKKLDVIELDQKQIADQIDDYFQKNTSISQQVQHKLKQFEEELKTVDQSSAEGRIKKIQFDTIKVRYVKVFNQNMNALENYRNIKKTKLEAQLRAKGVKISEEELNKLLEDGLDIHLFTENILAETAEAKRVLQDLEDRHQQLLKIERMLENLRSMFLQMFILIEEQQDLIDRVEYQADMAKEFIGKGKKDLRKSEKNKRKFLKRKIILIVVILVLLAVILGLIFK